MARLKLTALAALVALVALPVPLAAGQSPQSEDKPQEIGTTVMERLKDLDPVAYVRFASVYRRFEDVGDFLDAVSALQGVERREPGR